MTLAAGARLGPYEILSALGAGGMGEVYRARDTRLDRDVAIKILPEAFAADAERVARFQREAKVLASLNHPNIAIIHGLEHADGAHALVMEIVEGEDLAQRITRGAIPLDEALPIAKQIAEALEAAHEQGIVHRDLKPANIKVRPDGTVKVLDFGLAKAMDPPGSSPGVSQSPTITTPAMTQAGMILGTAAYMSPEQAKGRPADKRSDLWAFGCVLYEMLTGKRVFEGEDVSDTLANILKSEPEWHALPANLPEHIRLLVRRCLEKDRNRRISDASIARFLITEPVTTTAAAVTVAGGVAAPARPPWRRALPAVVTAVVVCALTAGAVWRLRPSVPAPVTRFAMALPDDQQWAGVGQKMIAMSPAGTHIVYTANRRLYLRSLSDLEVRPVTGGANNSGGTVNPVFSPDGRSIAYFDQGDRTIKRIALSGGAAVTVCEADYPFGMSWDGDTIFFGQGGKGIMRVSANGGKPETVASVKTGELAHGPQLLPDGQTLLFTLATGVNADRWDKARIVAESLKSHERKTLLDGGSDGRYLPTGRLVYALSGVVFAVPFDVKRMMPSGGPVPMVEGVRRANATGSAQFAISDTGSLAYVPGPVSTLSVQLGIGLFDRKGGSELLKVQPGAYQLPRMSPDGTRIAFGSDDGKAASIWIYELSATSSMRRVTFEGQGHNRFPVWSADSQRVAFQSDREGDLGIFWQRADGAGTAERLTKAEEGASHIPESWAPDGERFLYNAGKGGATSLWVFSLKDRKAVRFEAVESPATTLTGAVFSPDGRWVAYASREGRTSSAVYVQPFPPTGTKYQISKNAEDGHHPMWSSDGAELVFQPGPGNRLNAVRITTHPSFTVGDAIPVATSFRMAAPVFERPYDISRDGQHFLGLIDAVQAQGGAPAADQIQVVLNWFEELKARVPTK